jgi:hypothetical protein
MIQIRQGVFETNSSSTHAVSIMGYDKNALNIPDVIEIDLNRDFGWERDVYSDAEDKASYLWMAVNYMYNDLSQENDLLEYKEFIITTLMDAGVKDVIIHDAEYTNSIYYDKPFLSFDGYIDHPGDLYEMVDLFKENPNAMLSYLFDSRSIVCTGNDNSDEGVEYAEGAEYYIDKGN